MADAALECLGERGGRGLVDRVALAQLADDRGHLLPSRRRRRTCRLKSEVEPAGHGHRVDEAIGHIGLDTDVLVVAGDGMKEGGQLLIIHGDLAEY